MKRKEYASLRLPAKLKRQISRIAASSSRTVSNTIELLILRGIAQFKRDGSLIERPPPGPEADHQIAELEHRLAELVADILKERNASKTK